MLGVIFLLIQKAPASSFKEEGTGHGFSRWQYPHFHRPLCLVLCLFYLLPMYVFSVSYSCGVQRTPFGIFHILRQGPSLALDSPRLVGQQASGIHLCHPLPCPMRILGMPCHSLLFLYGSWGIRTQVFMLSWKTLYQLSHLPIPRYFYALRKQLHLSCFPVTSTTFWCGQGVVT